MGRGYVFDPNESRMASRMAEGHQLRKGHRLTGVWVYGMPGYRELQRTCCGGSR